MPATSCPCGGGFGWGQPTPPPSKLTLARPCRPFKDVITMNRISAAFIIAFACTTLAADWPQWRGPDRDGVSKETGLLKHWPEGGPKLRWKADDIGTGYSTPIVVAGRVYVQSTRGDNEVCLALDEQTGKPVWSVEIGKVGKNSGPQYPGTRA